MTEAKERAIELIKALPDDITFEDLLDALMVQLEVALSIEQLDAGQYISQEQMKNEMETNLKRLKK